MQETVSTYRTPRKRGGARYPAGVTYPPPGVGYPAPPQPPRRRNTLRIVLIVVGIAAVVCLGAAAALGYVIARLINNTLVPPQQAARAYLEDLVAGDSAGAYGQLCATFRDRYTLDEYTELVEAQGPLEGFTITGTNVNANNGTTAGWVRVVIRFSEGPAEIHELDVAKEGDDWRPCGDPF